MDQNLKQLQDILKLVMGSVTKEQFVQATEALVAYVTDIRRKNDTEFTAIHQAVKVLSSQITEEKDKSISDIKGQVQSVLESLSTEKTAKMAEIDAKIATIRQPSDGNPGQNADEEAIKNAVLKEIKIPTVEELQNDLPKLGAQIRDALELLQDEERLDASAIKNLPEFIKNNPAIAGVLTASALYSLADVSVQGIVAGQSIQWDGIKWIPYTPSGGSGTSVFGENLTPQGPGITYTLAHTPQSGTVRLYRGGAYQQVGVDYTISGATITLTQTTQAGETLLADYIY